MLGVVINMFSFGAFRNSFFSMGNHVFHEGKKFSTAFFVPTPKLPIAEQVGQFVMEDLPLQHPVMGQKQSRSHPFLFFLSLSSEILSWNWNNSSLSIQTLAAAEPG